LFERYGEISEIDPVRNGCILPMEATTTLSYKYECVRASPVPFENATNGFSESWDYAMIKYQRESPANFRQKEISIESSR
jgi:hypothetical protein